MHDVEAGLHPWIAILDFKSMYPSIMIGHNICYTTRLDSSQEVSEEEQSMIHTAPSGVRYWGVEKRQGLIPYLLKDLMAQRDFHKSELKSARAALDEGKRQFHDSMQYACKNSDELILRGICKRILSFYSGSRALRSLLGLVTISK